MAQTPKDLPQISLDGKWFSCQSAGEFGFLGDRTLCDLTAAGKQAPKILLVRPLRWFQGGAANGNLSSTLEIDKIPAAAGLELRPFAIKTYEHAIPASDGKLGRLEERQFLQQEITGLLTLREAILKVVRAGSPRKVWHLFYSACKALNKYAKSVGPQRLVSLQCPNGLGVDAKTGQVVLLDAEMRIPVLSDPNAAAFVKWFGSSQWNWCVQENEASLLHSRALLLFFREALGYLDKQLDATAGGIPNQLGAQLNGLAAAKSLQELADKAQEIAEDWSLPLDEDNFVPVAATAPPAAVATVAPVSMRVQAARPAIRLQGERTWLGWFVASFLANLLLAALLALFAALWLFGSTKSAAREDKKDLGLLPNSEMDPATKTSPPFATSDSSLQFSSYCVVFPARGTSSEKVVASLRLLYPGKVLIPKQGESEQNQMLSEHLDLAVKSLKETDKIQKLLAELNSDHAIGFNGYSLDAEDAGLKSLIASGGLYKIVSPAEKVQYGSLLRANALGRILAVSGVDKRPEARILLESLKKATHEYASIKDALTIIGDRTAFIIRVEPTAKAHELVCTHLLNRDLTPVFVPRPVFELFDAVDPAAGTGGGVARYSLKLDRKCNWRLVSSEDRRKTDFVNNPTNNKMKWLPFAANQEIVWTTLPVLRQNGRTDSVSSFDIAIAVNNKVAVFRNQSILTGDSKAEILKQARGYLDSLGFKTVAIEDALSVRQQEERFTGALLYNYLADQAKAARGDLELVSSDEFDQTREREDNVAKSK
jgi:hypothetical protein